MKIQEIIDLPELSHDEVERQYLIFSDAQFDLIYENQKVIDLEFTEEEKNFRFI
mgnify:FL=1